MGVNSQTPLVHGDQFHGSYLFEGGIEGVPVFGQTGRPAYCDAQGHGSGAELDSVHQDPATYTAAGAILQRSEQAALEGNYSVQRNVVARGQRPWWKERRLTSGPLKLRGH